MISLNPITKKSTLNESKFEDFFPKVPVSENKPEHDDENPDEEILDPMMQNSQDIQTENITLNRIHYVNHHTHIHLTDPEFLTELEYANMKCSLVTIDMGDSVIFKYDSDYDKLSSEDKNELISKFFTFFSKKFSIDQMYLHKITIEKGSVLIIVGAAACLTIIAVVLGKYACNDSGICEIDEPRDEVYAVSYRKRAALVIQSEEHHPAQCNRCAIY